MNENVAVFYWPEWEFERQAFGCGLGPGGAFDRMFGFGT